MNARIAGLALLDLTLVARFRPNFAALNSAVTSPERWLTTAGIDGAATTLAGLALWLVGASIGCGLSGWFLARSPALAGTVLGTVSRTVADVAVPKVLQRLVCGAAGAGIFVSPVAGFAEVPAPAPPLSSSPHAIAAPAWPLSGTARSHFSPGHVTVAPGESLWTIARSHLTPTAPRGSKVTDAEVTAAWPSWYAANRKVIGSDPNVVRAGTELSVPASPEHVA